MAYGLKATSCDPLTVTFKNALQALYNSIPEFSMYIYN